MRKLIRYMPESKYLPVEQTVQITGVCKRRRVCKIAFSDICMRGVSGIDVAKQVKRNYSGH